MFRTLAKKLRTSLLSMKKANRSPLWQGQPHKRRRAATSRPRLEVLEDRTLLSVNVLSRNLGIFRDDLLPENEAVIAFPDTALAAGPDYLVEAVNTSLAFFNKTDRTMVPGSLQKLDTFFGDVTEDSLVGSPLVTYDELSSRFVVAAHTDHFLHVAVSDTADPRDGFSEKLRINIEQANSIPDLLKIGWNADALVISVVMIVGPPQVVTFDWSKLLSHDPIPLTSQVTRPHDYAPAPATMHGSQHGDPMWFVDSIPYGPGQRIDVVRMRDVLSRAPEFMTWQMYITGSPPDTVPQPGGPQEIHIPHSGNINNASWRNGRLVACHTAFDVSLVDYLEVDTTTESAGIIGQGYYQVNYSSFAYYASIEIAPTGDLGVSFMQSSSGEYVSMYVAGQTTHRSYRTPQLTHAGQAYFTGFSGIVGRCASISVDPVDGTFWAANMFRPSTGDSNNWGTGIDNFSISPDMGEGMGAAVNYGVGSHPQTVATGDFDGDGTPDLAVVNRDDGTVSILLGNRDGTFRTGQTFAVGAVPVSVVVGDFNGDGKLDLLTVNGQGLDVSVLLGNGDGTFQAPRHSSAGPNPPEWAAVGDFYGDGILDVAVVSSASGTLRILRGRGDGFFSAPVLTYSGLNFPVFVAAADLTGNGNLDLITANLFGDSVSVFRGNGDGTFRPPQNYAAGPSPSSLAVADLNGDGKLDLVVTNDSAGTVSVLLGRGDGTFGSPRSYAVGSNPHQVAVGDFNGDGHLDLAVVAGGSPPAPGSVSILLGNGDGTFRPGVTSSVGADPRSVAAATFHGDGVPDLVVANRGSNTVSVLLNAGYWRDANLFPIPTPDSGPTFITQGTDRNLWFTEQNTNKIGRITPDGAVSGQFSIPTANAGLEGITTGPDGNLWFAEGLSSRIGRMNLDGVVTNEFLLPASGADPYAIVTGRDGNLWFTEVGRNKIGRITPEGIISEFIIPSGNDGYLLTAGPDGNLWFTEYSGENMIGRITPAGTITEFTITGNSFLFQGITAGPDGNLWLTNDSLLNETIVRLDTQGAVTGQFPIPTHGGRPGTITAGPDGALWFLLESTGRIGRITVDGAITEYAIPEPPSLVLSDLTVGPDGNLWFTQWSHGGQIGRLVIQDGGGGGGGGGGAGTASVPGTDRPLTGWPHLSVSPSPTPGAPAPQTEGSRTAAATLDAVFAETPQEQQGLPWFVGKPKSRRWPYEMAVGGAGRVLGDGASLVSAIFLDDWAPASGFGSRG
jgi:streptogramin lyase